MAEKRVQRRLAAILAADVDGYSRLMRADETGTLARLKVVRGEILDPITAEYGGRIVKTTGDGVLVEFASAVDATECAIKIQRALARRNDDVPEGSRIKLPRRRDLSMITMAFKAKWEMSTYCFACHNP